MSYRPQVKQNGGMQDLPLDAETVKGRNVTQELDNIKTFYAHGLKFDINNSTFVITATLTDGEGNTLSSEKIDLPLESVVVDGEFNAQNDTIVLTLQNGNTIDIPVGDLIDGLASQIEVDDLSENVQKIINGTTTVGKAGTANSLTAVQIPNNADLNDYVGSEYWGKVFYATGEQAISNSPVPASYVFHLEVLRLSGNTVQVITAGSSSNNSLAPTRYFRYVSSNLSYGNWEEIVTSDGNYPTLGAGHLQELAIIRDTNIAGWYQIGSVNYADIGTTNTSVSVILLINGLFPDQGTNNTSGFSGIVECDFRTLGSGQGFNYCRLSIWGGNITENDICVAFSGTSAGVYFQLQENYESICTTILSQNSNNSNANKNYPIFKLTNTYYGTTAPSGAVYAVNKNHAAFDSEGNPFSTGYVNTETDQLIAGGKVFSTSTWTPMAYIGLVNNDTAPLWQFTPAGIYYIPNRSNLFANKLIAYNSSKGLFVLGTNFQYTYEIPSDENSTAIATTEWVKNRISEIPSGVSMIPDTGNATSLSVPSSGGTVYIEANGWLCINLNKTTAHGQFLSMTVTNSSGTDVWGGVNKTCSYFSNNYPVEFLPVKAGDYVKFQYTVTPSRILLIKTL